MTEGPCTFCACSPCGHCGTYSATMTLGEPSSSSIPTDGLDVCWQTWRAKYSPRAYPVLHHCCPISVSSLDMMVAATAGRVATGWRACVTHQRSGSNVLVSCPKGLSGSKHQKHVFRKWLQFLCCTWPAAAVLLEKTLHKCWDVCWRVSIVNPYTGLASIPGTPTHVQLHAKTQPSVGASRACKSRCTTRGRSFGCMS